MPIASDKARDRRIEALSNLYLVHPLAHALLPVALRWRISANAISLTGLALGAAAAACYSAWHRPWLASIGVLLSLGWLVADGLDGMVARATHSASAAGRLLDGLCDHGVFVLIYMALAASLGSVEAWVLAIAAGALHAVQSSLYEGERARFHRRARGGAAAERTIAPSHPLLAAYDRIATSIDHLARPFERRLARDPNPTAFGRAYARDAAPVMRWMAMLSANVRVAAIFVACVACDPALFWMFEIAVLSPVAAVTLAWHRLVERRHAAFPIAYASSAAFAATANKEQGYR